MKKFKLTTVFLLLILFGVIIVIFSQMNYTKVQETNVGIDEKDIYSSDIRSLEWNIDENKINDDTLISIFFVSKNYGWAAGVKGEIFRHNKYDIKAGNFFRTVDGGQTWKKINLTLPDDSFISKIIFTNELMGWLIVQRESNFVKKRKSQFWVLETKDGGDSWQSKYTQENARVSDLIMKPDGEGWIVGAKVGERDFGFYFDGFTLYTNDLGEQWKDIYKGRISDGKFQHRVKSSVVDIQPIQSGQAFVLFNNGIISMVDSNNNTWKKIADIQLDNSMGGFGTGFSKFIIQDNYNFLTLNGGNFAEGLWSTITKLDEKGILNKTTLEDVYLLDIAKISESEVLACGYSQHLKMTDNLNQQIIRKGVIFYSQNRGQTWQPIYEKTSVILSTNNGGETWEHNYPTDLKSDFVSFNKITKNNSGQFHIVGSNGIFLTISKK